MITVTANERDAGRLDDDKIDTIRDSLRTDGFVTVGDLIGAETRKLLVEAYLEDVDTVRSSGKPTMHEKVTGRGHLQLGPRRRAPYVRADLLANPLIEHVVASVLGAGAWLGFYNGNVCCPDSTQQPLHFNRPFSWKTEAEATAAGQRWPPPTTTLSCSVALTEITTHNGATEIYPGSHRETTVTTWKQGERLSDHPELVEQWGPPARMEIPEGSVCFRDPRMWHRGMTNHADQPRPMITLTYHAKLGRHSSGRLVPDLAPEDVARCDADPTLKVLDGGELGDGRLVFHESARSVLEGTPSQHGVNRNARFVGDPFDVDHLRGAHLLGGARVVEPGVVTVRQVDHVVVTVHDIDAAIETWETLLGVPVTHRVDIEQVGIRQAFFSLDTGFIELVAPMSSESPLASRPEGVHTIALEVEDMDATVDALVAKGVRILGQGTPNVVVHPASATGVRVQLWPTERPHRWKAAPNPDGA